MRYVTLEELVTCQSACHSLWTRRKGMREERMGMGERGRRGRAGHRWIGEGQEDGEWKEGELEG